MHLLMLFFSVIINLESESKISRSILGRFLGNSWNFDIGLNFIYTHLALTLPSTFPRQIKVINFNNGEVFSMTS